jgi:hypothetical protein
METGECNLDFESTRWRSSKSDDQPQAWKKHKPQNSKNNEDGGREWNSSIRIGLKCFCVCLLQQIQEIDDDDEEEDDDDDQEEEGGRKGLKVMLVNKVWGKYWNCSTRITAQVTQEFGENLKNRGHVRRAEGREIGALQTHRCLRQAPFSLLCGMDEWNRRVDGCGWFLLPKTLIHALCCITVSQFVVVFLLMEEVWT